MAIDNNQWQRAIEPFVIGKKSSLLRNATSSAKTSAILCSIIETPKPNNLTLLDYIMHCLELLAASPSNVEILLPRNVKSGKVKRGKRLPYSFWNKKIQCKVLIANDWHQYIAWLNKSLWEVLAFSVVKVHHNYSLWDERVVVFLRGVF